SQTEPAGDATQGAEDQGRHGGRSGTEDEHRDQQQHEADDLRATRDEHAARAPRGEAAGKVTGTPGRRRSNAEQDARLDMAPPNSLAARMYQPAPQSLDMLATRQPQCAKPWRTKGS